MDNLALSCFEQRNAARFKTSIWVKANSGDKEFSAEIVDISTGGAALSVSFVKPSVGNRISLSSTEYGCWRGKVQWVAGGSFGVMFDRDTQNDRNLRALLRSYST